jgi:hypothetical protein
VRIGGGEEVGTGIRLQHVHVSSLVQWWDSVGNDMVFTGGVLSFAQCQGRNMLSQQ